MNSHFIWEEILMANKRTKKDEFIWKMNIKPQQKAHIHQIGNNLSLQILNNGGRYRSPHKLLMKVHHWWNHFENPDSKNLPELNMHVSWASNSTPRHTRDIQHKWVKQKVQRFSEQHYLQSVCLQCGRPGFDSWVRKFPWRRKWQPTPVFLPGESQGRRSLVGYSSRGRKESDTTSDFTSLLNWNN